MTNRCVYVIIDSSDHVDQLIEFFDTEGFIWTDLLPNKNCDITIDIDANTVSPHTKIPASLYDSLTMISSTNILTNPINLYKPLYKRAKEAYKNSQRITNLGTIFTLDDNTRILKPDQKERPLLILPKIVQPL